jgi:cell division protein FtsN
MAISRTRVLFLIAALVALSAAMLSVSLATAHAATCPTVDTATGSVTPPPTPSVDWSGCNLTNAALQPIFSGPISAVRSRLART